MTLEEFKSIEELLIAESEDFSIAIEAIKYFVTLNKCTNIHIYLLSKSLLFNTSRDRFIDELNTINATLADKGLDITYPEMMLNLTGLYKSKRLINKKDKDLMEIFSYVTGEVVLKLIRSLKLDEIIDDIKIKLK